MSATKITYSLPIPDETLKDLWKKEQIELRQKLVLTDDLSDIQLNFQGQVEGLRLVGGVDLSFPTDNDRLALAGLVILEYPSLKVIYEDFQEVEVDLPYIPGFLAFREVKVLLGLVQQLRLNRPELLPQVLLVDGNGVLHPRGFGLASHLGVLTDIPTIGVAKNFLQIDDGEELTMDRVKIRCQKALRKGGDRFPLIGSSGTIWGMAVRTLDTTTNPIFVSTGHKVSHETAVAITLQCSLYRIPEPIRQADLRTRNLLRARQQRLTL